MLIVDAIELCLCLEVCPLQRFDFLLLVSEFDFHVVDASGEHPQILVEHQPRLVFRFVLVGQLLDTSRVLFDLKLVLVLDLGDLLFVLGHQSLLGVVGLVAQLLDDGLYLPVAFPDHLLTDFPLGFDMLVLCSLQHV